MPIKYYQLTKWDKVRHGDDIHTFNKMDWMYAQWTNEKWDIAIWHYDSYELGEDWIYNPVPVCQWETL
jgi:hypothetical protein